MPLAKKANAERRRELKHGHAKSLRVGATVAERKLWTLLRGKQMESLRFRRQQPIGPYIADFFCARARLIVELDGGQHSEDAAVVRDAARTDYLNARGYRVLRFSNQDMLQHPDVVLDGIWRALNGRV